MKLVSFFGASIGAWLALATIEPAEAACVTSCMAGKGCGLQYESGRNEAAATNDAVADRRKRGGKKCEMQRAVCSR